MAHDPNRCPACGGPNACGIAAGLTTCWCFDVAFPPEGRAKVAASDDSESCLCASCALDLPPSPCIGVCKMDPAQSLCTGCGRSVAEISGWTRFTPAEKRAVLERLAKGPASS